MSYAARGFYRLVMGCSVLLLLLAATVSATEKEYTVSGISMSPTLRPGYRVVVESLDVTDVVERNDLVALRLGNRTSPLLKRGIAVEGDKIELKENTLKVNGSEIRVIDPVEWKTTIKQLDNYGWVVPSKSLLVLGDNAENSRDSRRLGLISTDQIKGKIIKIYKK